MNIIESLTKFNKDFEKQMRRTLPVIESKLSPLSCTTCTKPGCCYQKVIIHAHEALLIADFLVEKKLVTPELRAKLATDGPAMQGATRRDWFKSATPCAFLVDGKCSVYSVRPFACRTYWVTSPAENCQPDAVDNTVAFLDTGDIEALHIRRSREIHTKDLGLKETNMRILMGALPRLVLMMLDSLHMDLNEWRDYVRRQQWPSAQTLNVDGEWTHGGSTP